MSAKMESRKFTPSVIARLMGLDELSPHQPVHKKQKVLSENYLRRVASVGVRGKCSSHKRHSFRLTAEEKKEFNDTFEVHGKLKREEHGDLPVEKGKFNLTLSGAKEVDNTGGVVDSNIDPFMKYLQEPDSLITDHLCNLQGIPYHLRSGCLTVLKSSNASDTGMTDICGISGRETDQESAKLLWKLENSLVTDTCGEHVPGNGYKLLESQKESDIVVLKPKLGKKENAVRCFTSCSSCRDCHSINKKHNSPEKRSLYEDKERKNVTKDLEPVRLRFRISEKNSGQTRQAKSNLFMKVSKPYSRDDDTSGKESELKTFLFPNSGGWKNHQKPLFYHSDGSYVGRKARMEILERLETTIKFQEVEVACGSSTLGEILAVTDQESSSGNLDIRLGQQSHSSQNGICSNLFMRPLESANRLQHRFRKQSNQEKGSEYRNSGSSCMKSQSFPCLESTNIYSVLDDRVLQGELNRKTGEKDTCELTNLVIKSSVDNFASASMIADTVSDAESGVEGRSSKNHKEKHSDKTDCELLVEDGYFSSLFPYASTHQDMSTEIFDEDSGSSFCSCVDPESLGNSQEAYQFSPNSVLESPYKKNILSSSACFQCVDANLQDLQLQLELLKSESSETCSEGDGMIVSSDDDFELGSVSIAGKSEQFMRTICIEEGRDFSYLIDVFTEAGFHDRKFGSSNETWHSSECLISPAVFETLEKKYGKQISWKRSERRLLFDRINSGLMEILHPSLGSHWAKPLSARLCFGKTMDMIEEELWMLLDHQKKQTNKDSPVKMMGKDDGWLELGADIEVIVKEIEDSLIDQLDAEVVSMESF